jgi:hypothetical protein
MAVVLVGWHHLAAFPGFRLPTSPCTMNTANLFKFRLLLPLLR